jgi:hypothetical protein
VSGEDPIHNPNSEVAGVVRLFAEFSGHHPNGDQAWVEYQSTFLVKYMMTARITNSPAEPTSSA